MRTWLAPVVWMGLATINALINSLVLRSDFAERIDRKSGWEKQSLRAQSERRWLLVVPAGFAVLCALRGLQTALNEEPVQWLWLLAGVAWLLALWTSRLARERTRRLLEDLPVQEPTAQDHIRGRYVRFYGLLSAGAFLAAQVLLRLGVAHDLVLLKVSAVMSMLVAIVAVLALGWAGVWHYRTPEDG